MLSFLKETFTKTKDRRVAPRVDALGEVRVDSKSYPLINWSSSGFLVTGHDDHLTNGQRFKLAFHLTDGDHTLEFKAEAVVTRRTGDKLGARFFMIEKHKKAQIAQYFARQASRASTPMAR